MFYYDDDYDLGFEIDLVTESSEKEKPKDPCICLKCGELYPYAEPNQKDGKFKCYSCRAWEDMK